MTYQLSDLGWSNYFARQISDGDTPARLTSVHRDRLDALDESGERILLPTLPAGDYAVGDWVLIDGNRAGSILARQSLLQRRAAGTAASRQLIAANVDTLFITTSCNADFNPPRLERYLALAAEAGCLPVIILTKADLAGDARDYVRLAEGLAPMQTAMAIDAHRADDVSRVMEWCGPGQTAALVGSSGVGKTTILNAMTGRSDDSQAIRENDAKGLHTTTARALRQMVNGGWIIDTPGMRALRLTDAADGIDTLFGDIADMAMRCRFSDCSHVSEPDCGVQTAIERGSLDPERLRRWRKLRAEDARNSETLAEARARNKAFGKMVRDVSRATKHRKGR